MTYMYIVHVHVRNLTRLLLRWKCSKRRVRRKLYQKAQLLLRQPIVLNWKFWSAKHDI